MATTTGPGARFEIAVATDIIRNWQRSSKATFIDGVMQLPPDTTEMYFRAATEADLTTYHGLVSSGSGDGARGQVLYNPADGSMSLVPDARPRYRVSVDKDVVAVGGGDVLTMTWERLLPGGAVNTNFNNTIIIEIEGRYFQLAFTAGVANQTFTPVLSARFRIRSTDGYRITNPLTFHAVE